MAVYGTAKQADLIITLMGKLRKFTSLSQVAFVKREVLTLPQERVKAIIDQLNSELGFSRSFSPASDAQRMVIADLEKKVYGEKRTQIHDPLTFAEADSKIKLLRAVVIELKSRIPDLLAPVTDLSSKRVS
ncbi:hypothetical protein BH09ACT3_BH09ACT3_08680 [soil metagenome]